jgi:hypothetical protein
MIELDIKNQSVNEVETKEKVSVELVPSISIQ